MGHRMAPGHQAYCVLWRYSSGVCPVCFLKARVRTSGPKAALPDPKKPGARAMGMRVANVGVVRVGVADRFPALAIGAS